MKKYLLLLFVPFVAMADIIPPPAATLTEVLAGTVKNKFVSPSTLAGTVATYLPRSNGSNDTAALQAACSIVGNQIKFFHREIYYTTNLTLTNGVVFDMNGATLRFIAGSSGIMVNTSTNNYYNAFYNGVFDGQKQSNYQAVAGFPFPINNYEITSGRYLNHVGLMFNAGGGGEVVGCTFTGFSGIGLYARNYWGSFAYLGTNGFVRGCTGDKNWISFYAGAFGAGGPYVGFAYDSAEYLAFNDCVAKNSGIGFFPGAGNSKVQDCIATANQIGLATGAGPNSQHGSFDNITLNHNTTPFFIWAGSSSFYNLKAYASAGPGIVMNGGYVDFTACTWSSFDANQPFVIITNSPDFYAVGFGQIWAIGNKMSAGSITNLFGVCSTNSAVYFYANSDIYGDSDLTDANGRGVITNATGTGFGTVSYPFGPTNALGNGIAFYSVSTRPTNLFKAWSGTATNWVYWCNSGVMTYSATNVNGGGWIDVIK